MLFILTALATAATSAPDPKANDAVAAFSQLCVGMFAGKGSDIDPLRYSVTKLAPDTAKIVEPNFIGDVWDVSGKSSDVHMLVHYEPSGMCVVQVAAANEADIRTSYVALVEQTAHAMNVKAERQQDRLNDVQGKPATTSMWRLSTSPQNIMFAVTTYPTAKFMIQHMMTISRVR
jgi:hypothetical protein